MHSPTAATARRVKAIPPPAADVVIIGAGLGGLMTAARLAQEGRRVVVLDQHYVAGGCATMFSRGSGDQRIQFDIGLHYVGECGPGGKVTRMLEEVGVHVDWCRLDDDGFDELVFPDFRFPIPASLDRYRDQLVARFPSERAGIDRYIRMCREVRHLGRDGAPRGWGQALDALLHGRLAAWNKNVTLAEFLDTCTEDPQLRAVIAGQNGDYGLPPSKVSLLLHCGLAMHYFGGAWYPRGGGQVIADRLAERIEALGSTVHLRHAVNDVLVESGRAVGVRYTRPHGETAELRAPVVVSNADPRLTFLKLTAGVPELAPMARAAPGWEMGGAIFLTCLALRADLGALGMRARNYWCFDGYDFEAIYRSVEDDSVPDSRGCYITSATRKDPDTTGHAPPGVETVEIMALVPGRSRAWGVSEPTAYGPAYRSGSDYAAAKARLEAQMIARMEGLFPGSTADIVHQESASPVTQTRFTWASDGTGYGLAATPGQFMANRPGARTSLPGFYLCGASTRSGHGIIGALASGVQAARAVVKKQEAS